MHKPRFFLLTLIILTLLANSTILAAPAAQTLPGTITLAVEAGYDGQFRENEWIPVIIRASNDGEDVSGRLVVRPETSSDSVTNTFSTPISLPSGGRQTVFLYITARSFASQIRVELLDDSGVVVTAQPAALHAIQPPDEMYIVLTESTAGALDLTSARIGGYNAYQANWSVDNLPDRAESLDSVNLMLFTDVDTGAMSAAQRQALADWVTRGGHLVVTGGPNWQGTAAGLIDLLPLVPTGSTTLDTVSPLGAWLRVSEAETRALDAQSVVSTGTLVEDANVLVTNDDGTPLLIRHGVGAGTVDYLTVDPNTQPLRSWGSLSDLWFTLLTTTPPSPGWAHGFSNWEQAAMAVEILPGFDPLPDILPLCGFLFAYIALIGPVNYIVLNRINRREWAWFTIPLFILAFSIASWVLGYNLRGNEVLLNRLAIVQSWADSDRARVDGLVGLLSPRRAEYSFAGEGGEILRPIPRPQQIGGALTASAQNSIDVVQTEQFRAADFSVDASFVAAFNLSSMIDKPDISGTASFAFDDAIEGQQAVRGLVRNDSAVSINDPVILARGQTLRLNEPLAPGDVATFDLTLAGEGAPASAPYMPGAALPYFTARMAYSANLTEQSVIDILGTDRYDMNLLRRGANTETIEQQTILRQQWLLTSLINDSFQSTGRGDNVYLAGWVDEPPMPVELVGSNWNAQSATLYLVELESEIALPVQEATITADRFTWVVREYNGVSDIAPVDLNMQPGEEVVFRFTPLSGAVLSVVTALRIEMREPNVGGRPVPLSLWNWQEARWESFEVGRQAQNISGYDRFLGPQNAVQVRLVADEIGGSLRIGQLGIEQVGTFDSN